MNGLARVSYAAAAAAVVGLVISASNSAQSQPRVKDHVPDIEDRLLRQLQTEGVGNRLHIKEIRPRCFSKIVLRYTKTRDAMRGEFGEDRFGDECAVGIYRYDGAVDMGKYTFIGEGGQQNRLTFALVDIGYVYLRGKGKVVFPDGRTVSLGC